MTVGDKLGDGGTATVFRASAPEFGEVAFKEYRTGPGVDADARPEADSVRGLIGVTAHLSGAERMAWLQRFAWPTSAVTANGATVGCLMPIAPDRFHVDYTTGTGARRRTKRRFADMQLLLNGPEFLTNRGIAVSRHQQLGLLRSAAEGFALLHARGVVVGDVSAKNLAFDVSGPEAAVYFIDCDAMTRIGVSGNDQHVETADWTVPVAADGSREPLNTVATDAYKFGLLVLRLLTGRQEARDPAGLPEELGSLRPLLTRALSIRPVDRPVPADWVPLLTAVERTSTKSSAGAPRTESMPAGVARPLVSRPVASAGPMPPMSADLRERASVSMTRADRLAMLGRDIARWSDLFFLGSVICGIAAVVVGARMYSMSQQLGADTKFTVVGPVLAGLALTLAVLAGVLGWQGVVRSRRSKSARVADDVIRAVGGIIDFAQVPVPDDPSSFDVHVRAESYAVSAADQRLIAQQVRAALARAMPVEIRTMKTITVFDRSAS